MKDTQRKAVELFTNTGWAARMWFLVSVCLFVLVLSLPIILKFLDISKIQSGKDRYIILDGAGTYSISGAKDFEYAKEVHEHFSIQVTQALLSKNPRGLDFQDLAERLLSKETLERFNESEESERELFRSNELHQKPEIKEISLRSVANGVILSSVTGSVLRTGLFRGEPYTEKLRFNYQYVFRKNADAITNRRFPLVVVDFKLKKFNEKGDEI